MEETLGKITLGQILKEIRKTNREMELENIIPNAKHRIWIDKTIYNRKNYNVKNEQED